MKEPKAKAAEFESMKHTVKTYKVTYDKANGLTGYAVVKATNEKEALGNAANMRFTGNNFRNPKLFKPC